MISAVLLASLLGTYLDLYFVGTGLYSFPLRPFKTIFTINIAFTLFGLPLLISAFLYVSNKLNLSGKTVLIFIVALLMSVVEKLAEVFGFFIHDDSWKHVYSFLGYSLYLTLISLFYTWLKRC